jgi:mannose-6-phosphate isomerase-like protein (cupin superfamily)
MLFAASTSTFFEGIGVKHKHLRFGKGFRVVLTNKRGQAAEMVIAPGDAEGNRHNRHAGADQWLFVVEGSGRALINGHSRALKRGDLLLIEKNDEHEIKNTGRTLLRTLNFYTPPAYRADGNPNRRGKPSDA